MTAILIKSEKIWQASVWCTENVGSWIWDWHYEYTDPDDPYVEFIIQDAWKLFEFCGAMKGNIVEEN